MTLFLKIVRGYEIAATTCGISLNLLLIFLIFTVNKSNMKQYTRTLLQNSVVDLLLSINVLISMPQINFSNGIMYLIVGNRFFSYEFSAISICAFCSTVTLSIIAMPVPFYVRYQILCKNSIISIKKLLALYIFIVLYALILFLIILWVFPITAAENVQNREALMTDFWLDEYKNGPIFISIPILNYRYLIATVVLCSATCISYFLIILFILRIRREFENKKFTMSGRTINLHKQLQRTLTLQTLGGCLTGNAPIFILTIMCLFEIKNNYISLACCSMLSWISVINPLVAIYIITPYRNKIKQFLRIRSIQISTFSQTEIQQH